MFIVVIGNVVDGLAFHGPFDTVDEAVNYGENCTDEWVTAQLTEVEMPLYKIVRHYQDPDVDSEIIETDLTLEEAQAHCQREDTHGPGWFDGYTEQ